MDVLQQISSAIFLLVVFIPETASTTMATCDYILNDLPSTCVNATELWILFTHDNEKLPAKVIDNKLYSANGKRVSGNTCRDVCLKDFRVAARRVQFEDIIMEIVWSMINQCCGGCANMTVEKHLTGGEDLKLDKHSSDFIFPIFAAPTTSKLYGYHFIPLLKIPDSYYFSLKPTNKEVIEELIYTCLKLWPLLVIGILFFLISGFVIWGIEMHNNKEEFPSTFRFGMFEGFWWSFVSMTTVGYGDKAPKSFLGRLYAIFWIIVGVTIIAVYIAHLTTDLMSVRSKVGVQMEGNSVGVLKGILIDKAMAVQHRGVPYEVEYNSTYTGIKDMIRRLLNKEYKGFLVNSLSYHWFSQELRKRDEDKEIREKFVRFVMSTRQRPLSDEYVAGTLVKRSDDYTFFREYFHNNRMRLDLCYASHTLNRSSEIHLSDEIVADNQVFRAFLYYSVAVLGGILIIGAIYEIKRYFKSREAERKKEETNV